MWQDFLDLQYTADMNYECLVDIALLLCVQEVLPHLYIVTYNMKCV